MWNMDMYNSSTRKYLFQCVLSAIIVVALRSLLLQILELPKIWRTSKYDFVSITQTAFSKAQQLFNLGKRGNFVDLINEGHFNLTCCRRIYLNITFLYEHVQEAAWRSG